MRFLNKFASVEAGKAPVLSYFVLVLKMGQVRELHLFVQAHVVCWQVPGLLCADQQLVMGRRMAAVHQASVHILKECGEEINHVSLSKSGIVAVATPNFYPLYCSRRWQACAEGKAPSASMSCFAGLAVVQRQRKSFKPSVQHLQQMLAHNEATSYGYQDVIRAICNFVKCPLGKIHT